MQEDIVVTTKDIRPGYAIVDRLFVMSSCVEVVDVNPNDMLSINALVKLNLQFLEKLKIHNFD